MSTSKTIHAFAYTENRSDSTQHRLWIGPLLEPEGTIGINTCTVRRDGVESSDVAIPLRLIPMLIAFLQQCEQDAQ